MLERKRQKRDERLKKEQLRQQLEETTRRMLGMRPGPAATARKQGAAEAPRQAEATDGLPRQAPAQPTRTLSAERTARGARAATQRARRRLRQRA